MALPKHVRFSEDEPLVYTFTPPATPRTPSPPSLDDDEYDYGYEDEDESGSEDSGPSTPPSTSTFPHRALPAVAGVNVGFDGGLLLQSSPKNSPKKRSPTVVSVNPILYDAHIQGSQLVWDVSTLPAEHAYLVPSSSSSSASRSPLAGSSPSSSSSSSSSSTPSGRAASLKGFIRGMHMGKGKDGNSNNASNNANPHIHARETGRDRRSGNTNNNTRGNLKQVKLGPSDRSLPATNPGLTSLDIHIPQLPPFWKPIQLRRSSSHSTHPSTASANSNSNLAKPFSVGEILEAIHRYLQQPITGKEYKTLPEALQKVIARSYWRRYDAILSAGGREEEAERVKKGGVRRVDALGGCTTFVAFVPVASAGAGEVWQVILSAPSAGASAPHAQAV